MKRTLKLLVASTALTAAIGIPAWSAMRTPGNGETRPVGALIEDGSKSLPVILVGDDDNNNRDRRSLRRGHDDEGDSHRQSWWRGHDDDDGEDDDDHGAARNAAPAGTVAPPQNGLFGTGAAPKVEVN